jgi:hypothetical protein
MPLKASTLFQIRHREIHHRGWPFGVDAAGRNDQIDLLAGDEALRTISTIGEGTPGTGDMVDPTLEGRRDREVDQASRQHDVIGRKQFVHGGIGHVHQVGLMRVRASGGV